MAEQENDVASALTEAKPLEGAVVYTIRRCFVFSYLIPVAPLGQTRCHEQRRRRSYVRGTSVCFRS